MARDWLLVETLGDEPAVVALGRQLKNLVPITTFLRRNPHLAAVRTAIAESLQTSQSLASITPKSDRVIRTEPVLMSDGRMHGVHIWSGPAEAEPPERPIPGPLKWDMTLGVATDTPESLANTGRNPEVEDHAWSGRSRTDCRRGDLKPNEGKVLAVAVKPQPGQTPVRHLGYHRLAGQSHPGELRRAQRTGAGAGWPRPRDRTGDELARRTGRPGAADRPARAADPARVGAARCAPGACSIRTTGPC